MSRVIPGYVVGAYVASPALVEWDPHREDDYMTALADDTRIGALELPWTGTLHPHDESWLLSHWPKELHAVLTDIPWTAQRLTADPASGLASADDQGRARAIRAALRLRDAARRLSDAVGARAVCAVELHSAPRTGRRSVDALARSLEQLSACDWDGAQLVVEHCDALVPEHAPEKGFLSLDDELASVRLAQVDVGLSLNWGRTAIELRDADGVAGEVRRVAESGLLRGLMISGASDRDGAFGAAWVDAHHPFLRSQRHPSGDPVSLLTEERVAACFSVAGRLDWRGLKVGWPPRVPGTVQQRVDMIRRGLDALDRAGV
ncbi:DUF4862 family protein [Humibacter ginsengiterrae]